jgi:alkaline phosphatase
LVKYARILNIFAKKIKTMKRLLLVILVLGFSTIFLNSCQNKPTESKIKYAFLFIGDGMGQAEINTAQAYEMAINQKIGFKPLTFTQFPSVGWVTTYANNRFITGSAAAGTALATGYKTNIGRISMNPDATESYESIAELAKKQGFKTGIITSVSIDHATPAVFYAHQPSRNNYFEIGMQLANSNMDFFGGGGFKDPVRVINNDTLNVVKKAIENGFTVVNTMEAFKSLKPGSGKVIAIAPRLAGDAAMPYVIDGNEGNPSLADFTQKAIELLQDGNGFFMMVEGGKIDWAGHGNDAAANIHETLAFDEAIAVAKAFYDQHPKETLIVVTADHETGGLALGNGGMEYNSNLKALEYQHMSAEKFDLELIHYCKQLSSDNEKAFAGLMKLVGDAFGLGDTTKIKLSSNEVEKVKQLFNDNIYSHVDKGTEPSEANYQAITFHLLRLISNKSGLGWTSHAHTGINVPVYAIGPGSQLFEGIIDNTEIPKKMEKLMMIQE